MRRAAAIIGAAALVCAGAAHGQVTPAPAAFADPAPPPARPERWAVHGQFTDIFQYHPAFSSPYQGAQSFDRRNHTGNTFDATLYLGLAPWRGAELWVDPELQQGFAPNNTTGVAGYVNGDGAKVGKTHPYIRLQRVFLRQTLDLGGGTESVEGDQNVLAGARTHDRMTLTLGKFNATDVFDTNRYAHDARHDFLNWSMVDAGSFDYAADAWGYTYGAAAELSRGDWTGRLGLFDLSVTPNSKFLTTDLTQFQAIGEVERRFTLFGRPGAVRATAFVTRGRMGAFEDAIALARTTGAPADASLVRRYRSRPGGSVNLEQEVAAGVGLFARAGWDDGRYESYEYTDIDRTLQAGVSVSGARWRRKDDTAALALVINAISRAHERYQDAGGLGILIGDGRLPHPDTEDIVEGYYSLALPIPAVSAALTFDTQIVVHPAYNADRGPVPVFGLRLHVQR